MNALPVAVAFVIAVICTGLVHRYAIASRLLDVPNERSSHTVPTPRGGGLAIAAAVAGVAMLILVYERPAPSVALVAWIGGALIVAAVGFIDDRKGLPARTRLLVHAMAALPIAVATGLAPFALLGRVLDPAWAGVVIAWIGIVWSVNSFNFMDGTDGLAAAQAVFVTAAAAVLSAASGGSVDIAVIAAVCAAGSAGFLVWNLPPARIFMGDVGSGFLGFSVAALALTSDAYSSVPVWTWLILHATFLADATATLGVRAARGERLQVAHRTHVYQRLARRWGSHRAVLAAYAAVNLLLLLPIAVYSVHSPESGPLLALSTFVLLSLAAVALGAGARDAETGVIFQSGGI